MAWCILICFHSYKTTRFVLLFHCWYLFDSSSSYSIENGWRSICIFVLLINMLIALDVLLQNAVALQTRQIKNPKPTLVNSSILFYVKNLTML